MSNTPFSPHTWGTGEVTFKDMANLESARSLAGFEKIRGTCEMAIEHGLQYAWVDTYCIDKSSSAELSEAINSMFGWHQRSDVCYVYLSDVTRKSDKDKGMLSYRTFSWSRWFSRGWTLLAPADVRLYHNDWNFIAQLQDDRDVVDEIVRRTGIPEAILVRGVPHCPGAAYTMDPLGYVVPAVAGTCGFHVSYFQGVSNPVNLVRDGNLKSGPCGYPLIGRIAGAPESP
ncbi:hypothetical protein OQA88_7991 [Cercophora sp. LCS_1]